ncbi:MAG: DUF2808 domain-containing protein [Thermostichus sp. HHBFW_bins_43]
MGILLWAVLGLSGSPAFAIQTADGTTYFQQVPRLLRAAVSPRQTHARGATLQITVQVPQDAGEPLQTLVIDQSQNLEALRIHPERIAAVLGDRWQSTAPTVPIQTELRGSEIRVQFLPALAPGTTITLGLRPISTPTTSGAYLYGVTALASGSRPYPYFLGYGRVVFAEGGHGDRRRLWLLRR